MADLRLLVPRAMQGRSFNSGRTPFEVLLFERRSDLDQAADEKAIKKHIVGKFSSYGDGLLFAQACTQRPCAEVIILRA